MDENSSTPEAASDQTGDGRSDPVYRAPASLPEVPRGPHTELRFTRPMQALAPALAGVLVSVAGLLLLVNRLLGSGWRLVDDWPWLAGGLVLLLIGAVLLRHAWRCLRHAYLILSPVGLEIFPLWRPEEHFRLLPWGEIAGLRCRPRALVVDLVQGGGVVLSLSPLWLESRRLLARALQGRAAELGIAFSSAENDSGESARTSSPAATTSHTKSESG